jgi:hypothetical protein
MDPEPRKSKRAVANKRRKTLEKDEKIDTYRRKIDEVEDEIVEKMEERELLLYVC